MLKQIRIHNYLFVPRAELSFEPGMTVLTGETGAGKSILMGAISLIFANSSAASEPWDAEQPVYLEADFDILEGSALSAKLEELGHLEGSELTLARQISVGGRSSYYVNGRKVGSSVLKELEPLMVDYHHQRDQQRLLQSSYQLEVLDAFAGLEKVRQEHASLLQSLRARIRILEQHRQQKEQSLQLADLYRFQYDEYEQIAIREGEDAQLQHEFERLSHSQQISETSAWVSHILYEKEDSVRDLIRSSIKELDRFGHIDERVSQFQSSLRDSLQILDDCADEAQELSSSHADPQALDQIRGRLDQINALLHKHRVRDIPELKALFAQRMAELEGFDALDMRITELETSIQADYMRLLELAQTLSLARESQSGALAGALELAVRDLAISNASFKISIDKKASPEMLMQDYLAACSLSGAEQCEFMFSANLGSELKPLADVASGGELSRVLLAIKKVLAQELEPRLLILDEIDAGVGGKTAEAVAATICELAKIHLVLCVTHLASIAAVADRHYLIQKQSGVAKTVIDLRLLDEQERIRELARMLSGSLSETSIQHAKELLNKGIR